MVRISRSVQALLYLATAGCGAWAQTVQPTIVEYAERGEGKFAITNNSTDPMTVVIEPKSFSIDLAGHGTFRSLDSGIAVELSTMSVRLQPLETYWIFYKAKAETYPAWFTIYSTFIPARKGAALNVRFQLPHTVYLYQKETIAQSDLGVSVASYSAATHTLVCDLHNSGRNLGRVQQVQLTGPHGARAELAGFPMLPGGERHLELAWNGEEPPNNLQIRFEHFTLKPAVEVQASAAAAMAPASPTVAPRD